MEYHVHHHHDSIFEDKELQSLATRRLMKAATNARLAAIGGSFSLTAADWALVACYFGLVLVVAVWSDRRSHGVEGYFLAGRNMPWWSIGFSLFASNLGTDHLVGLAGSGAASGMAVGNYEWSASYTLLLLGWVFLPQYMARKIRTVPEFLEKRYSSSMRDFFTWLTLFAAVFTKISVTIFAGAVITREIFGWDIYGSSVAMVAATGCYVAIGGLSGVIWTESIQSVILLLGTLMLVGFAFHEVGGWGGLRDKLPPQHFSMIRPLGDRDFPWLGVLLGMPINSVWYWCTDQVMVQRALAASDVRVGKMGCVFAAWLKVLPMFIMVLPGMAAAALYPAEMRVDSNRAFPLLVTRVMPGWSHGLMVAMMLCSFMSALASCFNSCSTLFSVDIYQKWHPRSTQEELVMVGRCFSFFLALVSLLWIPVIQSGSDQLFLYIQGMQTVWCAPVAVVFIAGVATDTVSDYVARVTLMVGIGFGVVFWFIQNAFPKLALNVLSLPRELVGLSVLHFAVVAFIVSGLVCIVLHRVEQEIGPLDSSYSPGGFRNPQEEHDPEDKFANELAEEEEEGLLGGSSSTGSPRTGSPRTEDTQVLRGAAVGVLVVVVSLTLYFA